MFRNENRTIGSIDMGGGNDRVINSSSIGISITWSSGSIVKLGSGHDQLINSGDIFMDVDAGSGHDYILNSGKMGTVFAGSGDDVFRNSGVVVGSIVMGQGNDRFIGGAKRDIVVDGAGDDVYLLGGGDDVFHADIYDRFNPDPNYGREPGVDSVKAGDNHAVAIDLGSGFYQMGDLYESSSPIPVYVNLSQAAISGWMGDASITLDALSAARNDGSNLDYIKGFESASGGSGGDVLVGSSGSNFLIGEDGDDQLMGGRGADYLSGGAGSDEFIYTQFSDSTLSRAGRDMIYDFDFEDQIVFSGLGLSAVVRTVAQGFSGVAGEVVVAKGVDQVTFRIDLTGDSVADLVIDVYDPRTPSPYSAAHFDFM